MKTNKILSEINNNGGFDNFRKWNFNEVKDWVKNYYNCSNFVEKTIIRVEQLQEKFDEAFMKLDMMECDRAIKTQQKVDLNTIYFFIQGAIAAANNCAVAESNKLYNQANMMLNNFIKNNCGCSGTNYVLNFQ